MITIPRIRSLWLASGILLSAAVAIFSTSTANAFTLQCKTFNCGKVSSVAKVSLLKVDPEPLPRVNPGDAQTITLEWSSGFALKSSYALCLTSSRGSAPAASDPCVVLPRSRTINAGYSGTTYEDTVSLAAGVRRPAANFYVKSTALFHLGSSAPPTATSNLVPFEWPLTLPNLYTHNPKPRLSGGRLEIEQQLSNRGASDAQPSITEYHVAFCDGAINLPLIDPEDPRSDRICNSASEGFVQQGTTTQPFNWIAAGGSETQRTDISAMLPNPGLYPAGLWIAITATADAQGDVDESNEQDNARLETRYITP